MSFLDMQNPRSAGSGGSFVIWGLASRRAGATGSHGAIYRHRHDPFAQHKALPRPNLGLAAGSALSCRNHSRPYAATTPRYACERCGK